MENMNLIDTFSEFKETEKYRPPYHDECLEDIFRNMLIKMYGSADNFDIIINIDKGDFEICATVWLLKMWKTLIHKYP